MKRETDWKAVYHQNYASKLFSTAAWIQSADDLLRSAECLEPEIQKVWEGYRKHSKDRSRPLPSNHFMAPYFMLISFAVENLFKSVLVRSRPELREDFQSNGRLPRALVGHDLVCLAEKADFPFTADDEDLLQRMSRHAAWAGRYPVPLRFEDIAPAKQFKTGKTSMVSWFGGDDVPRIKTLIGRIRMFAGATNA